MGAQNMPPPGRGGMGFPQGGGWGQQQPMGGQQYGGYGQRGGPQGGGYGRYRPCYSQQQLPLQKQTSYFSLAWTSLALDAGLAWSDST